MKNYYLVLGVTGFGIASIIYEYFFTTKGSKTEDYLAQLKGNAGLSSSEILLNCVKDKTCSVEPGSYSPNEAHKENSRVANLLDEAIMNKDATPFYQPPTEFELSAFDYAKQHSYCGQLSNIGFKNDIHDKPIEGANKLFYDCATPLYILLSEYYHDATHPPHYDGV